MKRASFGIPFFAVTLFLCACGNRSPNFTTWRVKGGNPEGVQYSSLTEINKENVTRLGVAWSYSGGGADTSGNRSQIQCNPIVVAGILYATTASLKAFAVDAATGKELWKFDPAAANSPLGVNRGVTYWEDESSKRILYSFGENLYALNAATGIPIPDFGTGGYVSLKEGLGERAANLMVLSNSPGVIYRDLIIIGSRVSEGPVAAPGYIRAFNVITGKLVWTFHTIPWPGEEGYETWPPDAWEKIGGANAWSGMTVDSSGGLVFAATGSASFDFYGGNRKGQNLYANCVLALDAATGKRKWHYQVTHHDLWDRDLPAAPVLISVRHEGHMVDAVVQVTKTGFVYLFDRETGVPLFPVEEIAVAKSDLDGEAAWPTQPRPLKPPSFARQVFYDSMISTVTPESEASVREQFKHIRTGAQFIPPSKEGTVIFPGFDGGAEWGGPSFDPETGVLYVNANEMPWILTMVDVRMNERTWAGIQLYRTHCGTCHGLAREGDGKGIPAIHSMQQKYNKENLKEFLTRGKGVMPSFNHIPESERDAIARYVLDLEGRTEAEKKGAFERQPDVFYSNTGYNRFLTSDGYPAVKPPWGTLNAIDLVNGTIKWQVPLGEFEELKKKGVPVTGTENYGGSVVTAGGVVFIAATRDEKIRAFDKDNGKLLWEYTLPFGGYATPSVCEIDGHQMLIIACGGGKMGTKSGDVYLAFTLPH